MRTCVLLGGIAAILASDVSPQAPAAARAETYDLRGPAPQKGMAFNSQTTFIIRNADTVIGVMGQTLQTKMTLKMVSDEDNKVLEVDGRTVTKSQAFIRKERAIITSDFGGGMEITEPTQLEGQTIISERIGDGKWRHKLLDNQPTPKQKKELDNRLGIENDDALYPEGKVPPGHEWEVPATALRRLFGNAFTELNGKIKQKFLRIEQVDGDQCAVIESRGRIRGKMKNEDGEPTIDVDMDLQATAWRSLATGLEVKGTFSGTIHLKGKQKVDDAELEIEMKGPFRGESQSRWLNGRP